MRTAWLDAQSYIMAPSLPLKIFNDYNWDDVNITSLLGNDDIDDLVEEIANVTTLINDTFGQKIFHENGNHYVWEYAVLLSILVIVVISIVVNLICGCSYCSLTRENATLEYRLQYRTSTYFLIFIRDQ